METPLPLSIYVDSSIKEGGGVIWDAARVFLYFLAKHPHGFQDYDKPDLEKELTILELGAGTGLIGLYLAKMLPKAKVTLTDMSPGCLSLMK